MRDKKRHFTSANLKITSSCVTKPAKYVVQRQQTCKRPVAGDPVRGRADLPQDIAPVRHRPGAPPRLARHSPPGLMTPLSVRICEVPLYCLSVVRSSPHRVGVHPPTHSLSGLKTHREFFIDNLLVRIHFMIVMIRWTGLSLWSLNFFFQVAVYQPSYSSTQSPPFRQKDPEDAAPARHRPGAPLRLARHSPPGSISKKMFIKSFCKSQFPPKYVNLSFNIININRTLTNLCGN